MQDYSQLVERISRASNLSKEEIERKIEAKRAKLSGLISKEGAAQIIAAELGISFEKEKVKINEILTGMKRVNLTGKIIRMFSVRSFEKSGKSGKVANFVIADETGNTRVVLCDTNHISLIETNQIKEGDVIEIANGSIRNNEIHLTGFSEIKKSLETIDNVKMEKSYGEKKLVDAKPGESIKTRAFIVQAFEPRFFEVCPECNKKLLQDVAGSRCEQHGKVLPSRRALLNIVLDDGTETMRTVLFSSQLADLGLSQEDLEKEFLVKRSEMLGRESFFSGNIRQNKLFGNSELIVDSIENIEVEKLIEILEKR